MSDFVEYKPMDVEHNVKAAVENLRKAYWSNETEKVAKIFTEAEGIIVSAICHDTYTVGKPVDTSGDLISRTGLKKCAIPCQIHNGALTDLCVPLYQIDNTPTVETYTKDDMTREYLKGYNACKDMNERPKGEWIKEDDEHLKGWYRCSECGRRVEDLTDDVIIHAGCENYTIADIYPYCHCGAEMKGGAE